MLRANDWGQVTRSRQTVSAASGANAQAVQLTTSYTYDAGGNVTQLIYPSGRKLVIGYAHGLPVSMGLAIDAASPATPLLSGIEHAPFGPPQKWNWAMASGTLVYERHMDTSGRWVRYPLGPYVRDLRYDAANRIVAYEHYLSSTGAPQTAMDEQHGYDAAGRLTSVTGSANSWSYTYDATGNRTSIMSVPGATRTATIAATSNRLTALSNPSATFMYDAMGNIKSQGTATTLGYDLRGRLASFSSVPGRTSTYTHDTAGRRVRKAGASSSSTVLFAYDLQDRLLGEYDENGGLIREYFWLGDQPVAMLDIPQTKSEPNEARVPALYYLFADHLNTPRAAIDAQGNLRWSWFSEPFGSESDNDNPTAMPASVTMPLRFPGQYSDSESGMFYNMQRDYAPALGRYVQFDPIGMRGGPNGYAYANQNPLTFTDPTGLFVPALGPLIVWGVPAAAAGAWAAMNPGAREALGGGWDALTTWAKPPENAYDPNGPKAPGKPGEAEGFKDPKGGENWVRNPNGRGYGWQGADGGVWCPTGPDSGSTGDAHGGPHWDVQYPGGRYDNIYPGGRRQ